jgi:hypothetical protein
MAAPSYTTDLTNITLAETTTGWSALGGGQSGLGIGVDFAMQGTYCVDKQITNAEKGQVYNNGATITPGTNTHFLVWVFLATPGLTDTLANRGLTIAAGTSTTAYNKFHVEGSDTYGAVGRVARCYPIRYVTTSSATPPYRTLVGTPGANPQYFGALANITGQVKGANLGVDAIRYGTGIYVTAGELALPATISGIATTNDTLSNRWGILTYIAGSSYELQGRLVIGQTTAGTPTAAYFDDSNKTILLVNTPHTLTDFTQIIVDHASTVFNMTKITIEAGGTHNPGRLVYNNASTTSALDTCTLLKIGISTLRAGVTATGTTWSSCDQITTNGATMTGCTVAASTATAAVIINSTAEMSVITNCNFLDNNRAINITAAGTYTFDGHFFDGNTYDVENSSTGLVTINASNGCNVSTFINTNGGTTTIVNTKTFTVNNIIADTEIRLIRQSDLVELAGAEVVGPTPSGLNNMTVSADADNPGRYKASYSYGYIGDVPIYVVAFNEQYQALYLSNSLKADNSTLAVFQTTDRQYDEGSI